MPPSITSRRRLQALGLALLTVAGLAVPAAARPLPEPTLGNEATASRAGAPAKVANACGPGLITLDLDVGVRCVHSDADPAPAPAPPGWRASRVPPKCYGNGVNGPRIELIYAYLTGKPNRASTIVPKIVNEWVPQMEATFRTTSKEQGRELGLRFWAPECRLLVNVEDVPGDLVGPGDPLRPNRNQFGNLFNFLYRIGYDDPNKKYLVWLDTYSIFACGEGSRAPDDLPAAVNENSGTPGGLGGPIGHTQLGVTYGAGCWGRTASESMVETHELLHTLGAVQDTSPNSNRAGHCTDDLDIMCYPDPKAPKGFQKNHQRCVTPIAVLDCGMDDYFAVNPAPGSYLATHHNVAHSQYLGDAIGPDLVPMQLPRL